VTEQLTNSVYNPTAQLSVGIDSSVTSLTVSDVSEFIDTAAAPLTGAFRVMVWDGATDASKEIIKVGAFDSGTGVCSSLTRAVEGKNAAQAHAAGDLVELVISAGGLEQYVSDHSGGGTRPFINETETGIVVNRASGFVSDWEEFDLGEPGAGYGIATFTAADDDGVGWGQFGLGVSLDVQMSADGVTWIGYYDSTTTGNPLTVVARIDLLDPVLVGQQVGYVALIPRAIRFRAVLIDNQTGVLYAGVDNPTFTFTFHYTAS
jgi:hypothetical protein